MKEQAVVYKWSSIHGSPEKYYVGYHNCDPALDGYITSSEDTEFRTRIENGSMVRQIIFRGSEVEAKAKEREYLLAANLPNNLWYNKAVNTKGLETMLNSKLVNNIFTKCQNTFNGTGNSRNAYSITVITSDILDADNNVQIRSSDLDEDHLRSIVNKMEQWQGPQSLNPNVRPIIMVTDNSGRLKRDDGTIVNKLIIDGKHTATALFKELKVREQAAKAIFIDFAELEFSNVNLLALASRFNNDSELIKKMNSEADVKVQIIRMRDEGQPLDEDFKSDMVKITGLRRSAIDRLIHSINGTVKQSETLVSAKTASSWEPEITLAHSRAGVPFIYTSSSSDIARQVVAACKKGNAREVDLVVYFTPTKSEAINRVSVDRAVVDFDYFDVKVNIKRVAMEKSKPAMTIEDY